MVLEWKRPKRSIPRCYPRPTGMLRDRELRRRESIDASALLFSPGEGLVHVTAAQLRRAELYVAHFIVLLSRTLKRLSCLLVFCCICSRQRLAHLDELDGAHCRQLSGGTADTAAANGIRAALDHAEHLMSQRFRDFLGRC